MLWSFIRSLLSLLLIASIYFFSSPLSAAQKNISLELNRVALRDAIYFIANFLNKNIIISSSVQGVVTLNLHHAVPETAFELLLTSHGLMAWPMGTLWYIAPRDEIIKRKQEEQQWQMTWDETAPLVTQTWQIKYASARDIVRLLQDEHASLLSKRGHVRFDQRTNIIFIQDTLAKIRIMSNLIKKLDVPVTQIHIEARLAAVDSDFERELGLNFVVDAPSVDNTAKNTKTLPGREAGRYSLAVIKLADSSLLDVKLSALENAGHAELISSPSLFTANQQLATIEAGEEVPYQEVSDSGGTAVVFKKAVLGLRATPQVLPGNKVLLQLQINQDRPSNKMVLGVPTISTRQITTNVMVRSGQTIVLGGIYESNYENGQQRLPFISQIPLVGWLFKRQNTHETKRELLIFVTPTIIAQSL